VRGKVYAHTAFADPRRDDHLGVELPWLLMSTGEDFCVDKHGLTLGVSHVYVSGEIAAHFCSGVPRVLPERRIASLAKDPSTSPSGTRCSSRSLDTIASLPSATVARSSRTSSRSSCIAAPQLSRGTLAPSRSDLILPAIPAWPPRTDVHPHAAKTDEAYLGRPPTCAVPVEPLLVAMAVSSASSAITSRGKSSRNRRPPANSCVT
jgi:hypothetical protein